MAAIDNAQAKGVLAGMLGITGFPASAVNPMWVRLMTANGVTTANGSEFGNGSGYTTGGQSGSFSAINTGAGGPTSQGMTAAAALSWTAATGTWVITGFELWDNAGTKLRWWFGTFTGGNVTVAPGQVLQIATNAISVTLS
jgi:hypothetical protein